MEPGPLRTERLTLRRFVEADAAGLHAYLSHPEAVRFEPYGVMSPEQCEELARDRAANEAFWAVCRNDDGLLVGNLYLARDEPAAWHTYELGYVFHPDHWGRGYATEAASRLLDACFGEWGAHRVVGRCDPANTASWRLLERLGMRREGHLLQAASFTDDGAGRPLWHDAYLYAVLDREWAARDRLTRAAASPGPRATP